MGHSWRVSVAHFFQVSDPLQILAIKCFPQINLHAEQLTVYLECRLGRYLNQ